MKNNIVSILCEGPHDVAFISKILKSDGYISNEKLKIEQYPSPINQLILTEVSKTDVKNLNIQEVRQAIIPSSTLQKDNSFLFLYSLGGDGKIDTRKKFLSNLLALIPADGEINVNPDSTLGIIYFFDSDNKGIATRVTELNSEIENIVGSKPFSDHMQTQVVGGLKMGCLIFTGEDNNTGKLEDILLPLMRLENEIIFEDAEVYISKHHSADRCKTKFDTSKSTIGVVGQLQHSGASNVVCIGKTDYITPPKIMANEKCADIISYLNDFIDD